MTDRLSFLTTGDTNNKKSDSKMGAYAPIKRIAQHGHGESNELEKDMEKTVTA